MEPIIDRFLNILFKNGETFCASPNKFGYHSVTRNDLEKNNITLLSPNPKVRTEQITVPDIALIAINPINGYRNDENVTAYRSFLIELDYGTLKDQQKYVTDMKMPYSACIFSGNKSLHYLITLENDINNEQNWRLAAQWILNIMEKADPLTKNPSRSIRFPGHSRKDGKQLTQQVVELKDKISNKDLMDWLSTFPNKKPQITIPNIDLNKSLPTLNNIPNYIHKWLENGIHTLGERNNKWFRTALSFAEANYPEDIALDTLVQFFQEQHDFKYSEWKNTIKSAYKSFERGE